MEKLDFLNDYVLTPIESDGSIVFSAFGDQKFIMKIRNGGSNLALEVKAIRAICNDDVVFYGVYGEREIALYRYYEYKTMDQFNLTIHQIHRAFEAIKDVQDKISPVIGIDTSVRFDKNLEKYLKLKAGFKELHKRMADQELVVFSDRSPSNFLLSEERIIPIDFDLMMTEPRLSDYAQFIDSFKLKTRVPRELMIRECLDFFGGIYTRADFNACATYRNLMQTIVFYNRGQERYKHYLKKALESM